LDREGEKDLKKKKKRMQIEREDHVRSLRKKRKKVKGRENRRTQNGGGRSCFGGNCLWKSVGGLGVLLKKGSAPAGSQDPSVFRGGCLGGKSVVLSARKRVWGNKGLVRLKRQKRGLMAGIGRGKRTLTGSRQKKTGLYAIGRNNSKH